LFFRRQFFESSSIFWLKNRRPDRWRDVQQIDQVTGHYLISDKPMSEDEWIEQRTKLKAIEHEFLDGTGAGQSGDDPDNTET
jgi:hypothetical protein